MKKAGKRLFHGELTLSRTCSDGATSAETTCTVIVREANILTDENIYGFETADGYELEGSGMELPSNQDVKSSEKKNADGSKTITYTCGDCGKFLGTEEVGPVKVTSVSLD